MDLSFNAYKKTIDPSSPVIVYKNGGFGFNYKNKQSRENFFKNLEAFDKYMSNKKQPNK